MSNQIIRPVDITHLPSRATLEAEAQENTFRIARDNPWIADLDAMAQEIAGMKGAVKAKFMRFRKLADRISQAIQPHSACQKHCAECCHIAVSITEIEADLIASASGRKRHGTRQFEPGMATKYFRQPCPFLQNNACSIYSDRPMACRLHFAISGTNVMCDTRVMPEDSVAINLNLNGFWLWYMSVLHVSPLEDIRYYFSAKA